MYMVFCPQSGSCLAIFILYFNQHFSYKKKVVKFESCCNTTIHVLFNFRDA